MTTWLLGDLPALQAAPHRTAAACAAAAGGAGWLRLGPRRWFVVSHPAPVREVLVTSAAAFGRAFQTRNIARVLGQGLLTNEGALWAARRRHLLAALYGPALAEVPARCAIAAKQLMSRLDAVADTGEAISPAGAVTRAVQSVITETLFGHAFPDPLADQISADVRAAALAVRACNLSAVQLPQWLPIPRHRRIAAVRQSFDDTVRAAIAAASPTALVRTVAQLNDPETGCAISPDDLVDEVKTLMVAGFETSASALAWTLLLLADNSAAQARWHAAVDGDDPEPVVRAIVQESLRLFPPIYAVPREVRQPVTIAGHQLSVGQIVLVAIFGTHRDPVAWEQPDAFRPERFLQPTWPRGAWLPFGGGPRTCVGAEFAMVELTRLLILLGHRYRFHAAGQSVHDPAVERAFVSLTPAPEAMVRVERR